MNNSTKNPPELAHWLFSRMRRYQEMYSILNDVEEVFSSHLESKGRTYAVLWYWYQCIISLYRYVILSLKWSVFMLGNYLKIAVRNIRKQKVYSLINMCGLATGLTCCLLVYLWTNDELSYDQFHENASRIYRIDWYSDNPQTRTPYPLTHSLVRDLPEVENAVSVTPLFAAGLTRAEFSVQYKNNRFDESGFFGADTTFFDVFSFELIRGNPESALINPGGIIITESMADKYFGSINPVGESLRINDQMDFTVTGVMKDIPRNSHMRFDFLMSYVTLKYLGFGSESGWFTWSDFGHYNYILISKEASAAEIELMIPEWSRQYIDWSEGGWEALSAGRNKFRLTPLTDIHLHSNIKWELETNGNIDYVYIFIFTALLVLIIASINYMNLATARLLNRALEVGMRKAIGAEKKQLIFQFLSESVLLSLIAAVTALLFSALLLPYFNTLSMKFFSIDQLFSFEVFGILLPSALIVGLVSGGYPAFYLSGLNPVKVLKGQIRTGRTVLKTRKILVFLQFALATFLIIGLFIVDGQLSYLRNMNLGFDKDRIVVVPLKSSSMKEKTESFKSALLVNTNILNATAVSNVPGTQFNQNSIRWINADDDLAVSEMRVDQNFFATLGIDIIEGRGFSQEFQADSGRSFILNKEAARSFSWASALNEEIEWDDDRGLLRGQVIGVTDNFHFKSLHHTIGPVLFSVMPDYFNYLLIKLQSGNESESLGFIESTWKNFENVRSFEYTFLDEQFDSNYDGEDRMENIFRIFTVLALLIGCMGLIGLTAYTTEQRTKEIGIRKVLGARHSEIVFLIGRDMLLLVILASLAAWPAGYYIMNSWLYNFAYKININITYFLVAAASVTVITALTVSYQIIKAAMTLPVKALKHE